MGEYFSTQSSLEARASALRLKGWIDYDGDGTIDAATLLAAQKYARGEIRDWLEPRFGTDIIDTWDSDTVPESVQAISNDLGIWFCTTTNPALAKVTALLYKDAIQRLKDMASGARAIYGVDVPVSDEFQTERIPSDFDPERELDDMTTRTTWILPDARELAGY